MLAIVLWLGRSLFHTDDPFVLFRLPRRTHGSQVQTNFSFGEWYDHLSDWAVTGLLCYITFTRYWLFISIPMIIVLSIVTFLCAVQISCQEIVSPHQEHNDSLALIKLSGPAETPTEAYAIMKVTRYFGAGTLICLLIWMVVYAEYFT